MKQLCLSLIAAISISACASLPDIPTPDTRGLPLIGANVAPAAVSDSFVAAEARVREAISARGFRLFAVVDHGGGALSVGRHIGQSKLFIFGNPKGGTPLLEMNPELGLALPLKLLIYTDKGGRTKVLTTDIRAVGEAYGLDSDSERLRGIAKVLEEMAREAAG